MLEFWFIIQESNFIVTPKTTEMCCVSYTKNGVKYTVFHVAYTLAELALTEVLARPELGTAQPQLVYSLHSLDFFPPLFTFLIARVPK